MAVSPAETTGADYNARSNDAVKSVLIEIAQTLGSYDAQRTYLRVDSGDAEAFGGTNSGYLSIVRQKARAWEFPARQGGWQANLSRYDEQGPQLLVLERRVDGRRVVVRLVVNAP